MYQLNSIAKIAPVPPRTQLRAIEVSTVRLTDKDETEVLAFLAQRPLHTIDMVGFINDNGLVSLLNRGTFYGCRDRKASASAALGASNRAAPGCGWKMAN